MSRSISRRNGPGLNPFGSTDPEERKIIYRIMPPARPAKSEREKFVLQLLQRNEPLDCHELISRLSSLLYQREVKIGGWALDLGIFGASLFVSEARRELELGKGILWEIDSPRKDSNGLLSNLSRNERPALFGNWRRHGGGA
jgi:hypothetical protein